MKYSSLSTKKTLQDKRYLSTTCHLKEKFRSLRTKIKRSLRQRPNEYFASLESNVNSNSKRFRSILRQKSKSRTIPNSVSMATQTASTADLISQASSRTLADSPRDIANLFNTLQQLFNQNILLSKKHSLHLKSSYILKGKSQEQVDSERDLGVIVS